MADAAQAQKSFSLMGQAFTRNMHLEAIEREFIHRNSYHRMNGTTPIDHLAERRKAGELGPKAKAAWAALDKSLHEDAQVRVVAALLLDADFTIEQTSDMITLYALKAEQKG